jgi:hypothetical protein
MGAGRVLGTLTLNPGPNVPVGFGGNELPRQGRAFTLPVTAESPVFHSTPNRNYVFSRDWNLSLVNRGHVNNAGFVNDQDYRRDGETPLLAVVGDSYIEALMVPYAGTVQARLAERLAGRLRVYSFAASGAPLSQYLIWARHAVRGYHAQALLIIIIGSLRRDSPPIPAGRASGIMSRTRPGCCACICSNTGAASAPIWWQRARSDAMLCSTSTWARNCRRWSWDRPMPSRATSEAPPPPRARSG